MFALSVRRPRFVSMFAVFALTVAVMGLAARPATAATSWTVVASGLDNPRHLAFGPNGQLYVAEAGRGGPNCVSGGEQGESCVGTSSRVTAVNVASGRTRTVVDGLFSIAGSDGSFAVGADGISFSNHGRTSGSGPLYVQMAANTSHIPPGADDPLSKAARAQLGQLLHVSEGGQWNAVASVGDTDYAWTQSHSSLDPNNPEWPDSNPYGIWATPGRVYVANAASNTLDVVRPNGSISEVAWFPNTHLTDDLSDSVPTCVVQTSSGILIGDLNGQLWKFTGSFTPEHQTLSGDGLASIEACATDGTNVYVADMFAGTVARISPSGEVTIVADGLNFPGGVAVGPGNTLYVSNNGTFPGIGEIVKVEL